MYKIVISDLGNESIKRISDGAFIPRDLIIETIKQFEKMLSALVHLVWGCRCRNSPYVDARISEYPPLQEQLDKIYHDGVES